MTPKEIYQLVIEGGSDHLGVFGGKKRGGRNIQQVPDEISPCLYYLQMASTIENYLEVGAASGGLTYLVNEVFHPERIVLIDNNRHGKSNLRSTTLKNVNCMEIIGDSQSDHIINVVRNLGWEYDLLVIDADHTYRGVKQDYDNYSPFCRKYLLLHDTVACKGVKQIFEELKDSEDFDFIQEFISATSIKCGLGLFRRSNVI